MTTLLDTPVTALRYPATWSKRSIAWAAARGLSQADVDALEAELATFRRQRDANTRATIAALLPEWEARAAAIRQQIQAKREALDSGRYGGAWVGLTQHDREKLEHEITALWREYAPLAADMAAARREWERLTGTVQQAA